MSAVELVSGASLYALPTEDIVALTSALTHHLENPQSIVAAFLMRSAQSLSMHQKAAAGFFLFSHGAIKLFLVIMVLRDRLWAYPVFIAALLLLIAYQTYEISLGFSAWLTLLTALDLVVLVLTWHEYRMMRGKRVF